MNRVPGPSAAPTFDQTFIEPEVLALTGLLGIVLLLAPRRFAGIPLLIATFFIPLGQRIAIATLDFPMARLLLICGIIRILLRREIRGFGNNPLDYALPIWVGLSCGVYVLQYASFAALVFSLGAAFGGISSYFLFRTLLPDIAALRTLLHGFAALAVVLAAVMSVEALTGRNLFAALGGVPEFTHIRHGRLRCQGPFSHPILAGTFGAALFPLCVGLALQRGASRWFGAAGAGASTAVVFLSASSGPLFSWLAGIGGWGAWLVRDQLRPLIWGTALGLAALQLFMNNPIWHLITRLAVVGGSTAYHRYLLIDQFLRRFPEWALLGTRSTAHWGRGLGDVTNHYVLEGIRGGVWGLGAFVTILGYAFRNAGRAVRNAGKIPGLAPRARRNLQLAFWGVGVAMFTHCVSFVGVQYHGQLGGIIPICLALTVCAERCSHRALRPRRTLEPRGAPRKPPADRSLSRPAGTLGLTRR